MQSVFPARDALAEARQAAYCPAMADGSSTDIQRQQPQESVRPANTLRGIFYGALAAFGWAAGLVAARHGVRSGLTPADLVFYRFSLFGLLLLPFVFRNGVGTPGGLNWGRALALTFTGGLITAFCSNSGFLFVPLGHGAVIQPSSASLAGLVLTALVLGERLPFTRVIGAFGIVVGLIVFGGESVATIGREGIFGDLLFVTAGSAYALFGVLLAKWRTEPVRATAVATVLSFLIWLPVHSVLFGYERMIAGGLQENLLQFVAQGILAGAPAMYFFTRTVGILGPARAAVFPALVPGFALLIGYLTLGEIPTMPQLVGFSIVMVAFALVQRR
jgi:drug/metabolite transporter (DMT)-like permease